MARSYSRSLSGVLLSFLDGYRVINIFALPLVVLIAWNVLMYVLRLRSRLFASFYSRWARTRIAYQAGRGQFNPFQRAWLALRHLRRFAGDWWEVARPLFAARARGLLHIAAIAVAVGLMAKRYSFRGIILRAVS